MSAANCYKRLKDAFIEQIELAEIAKNSGNDNAEMLYNGARLAYKSALFVMEMEFSKEELER